MMKTVFVLAVLFGAVGCSGSFGGRALRTANVATLAASTVSLAWDGYQTRHAASGGWRGYVEAGNAGMVIGSHPSVTAVEVYFASAAVLNAAIWWVMPERWRSVVPGVVISGQAYTILNNPSFSCRHVTAADGRPATECR